MLSSPRVRLLALIAVSLLTAAGLAQVTARQEVKDARTVYVLENDLLRIKRPHNSAGDLPNQGLSNTEGILFDNSHFVLPSP